MEPGQEYRCRKRRGDGQGDQEAVDRCACVYNQTGTEGEKGTAENAAETAANGAVDRRHHRRWCVDRRLNRTGKRYRMKMVPIAVLFLLSPPYYPPPLLSQAV